MSWQATDAVWKLDLGGDTGAKVVLLALAYRQGVRDDATWPSQRRIAADTEQSRSTVREALHRLEAAGLIEVIHSPGRTSRYRLTPPESVGVPKSGAPDSGAHPSRIRRAPLQNPARYREQDFEHE